MMTRLLFFVLLCLGQVAHAGVIKPSRLNDGVVGDKSLKPAVELIRLGRVAEARTWLLKNINDAHDKPHPDVILAQLLGQLGHGMEARRVMESVATAEPDRLDVRVIFCELAARESRWFEAISHAVAAEKASIPANWSADYAQRVKLDLAMLKAASHEGRGEWKAAKDVYTILAKGKNVTADVHSGLGRCSFHLEQLSEAGGHFSDAFALDPQREIPGLALATLLDASGKTADVEKHFRSALQHKDPTGRARATLAFARWLIWNNRPAQVLPVLATKFDDADQTADQQLLLAMAARMTNRLDDASAILSRLHQDNPTTFAISNHLALVLIESDDEGKRSRAQQIAEANARNNSKLAEAWSTLGWVQFRLGDLASAKQNLSRAISSGVISRDTAWQLAQVQQKLGNKAEAEKLLAAARSSKGPFFAKVQEN